MLYDLYKLPVSSFADDLDLEIVDPAGSWDGVSRSDRRCVFVVLPAPCNRRRPAVSYLSSLPSLSDIPLASPL